MNQTSSAQATIDGVVVAFTIGEKLIEVAARAGRRIPTLCYDDRVGASASCRLCVVKVKGRRLPVAACAQAIEPGMEVVTDDPELRAWRQGILELTLSESSGGTCLSCQMHGPCELHALAAEFGASSNSYPGSITSGKLSLDDNPFILRDYSQCIYCFRCTRVCGEHEQAHAIGPSGRGFATAISAPFDTGLLESPCTFCGQCIQTCPTGALLDRRMVTLLREQGELS